MKKSFYTSPSVELLYVETTGCLLSSSEEPRPLPKTNTNNAVQPKNKSTKAASGKLIIVGGRPNVLFSKVKVSINDEIVEEITSKGQFVIPIKKDCEVKFRWQLLPAKYITACANEIKIVKLSYGQANIKLNERVYARDGVKLEYEPDEENSGSNAGLKVAGMVALGLLAASVGAEDDIDGDVDFDADFDGDFDMDMDGDGIADSIGFDTDGDGMIDAIGSDLDGDGYIDSYAFDSDFDGEFDSFVTDTDGDGVFDAVGVDTNGDGYLDTIGLDTDGDGMIDQVGMDTDYDGDIDTVGVDFNADGNIDYVATDWD